MKSPTHTTPTEVNIPDKYFCALTKTFSPIVLDALLDFGDSKYLKEILLNSGIGDRLEPEMTMAEFFEWLFNNISEEYRNEYVYKNIIAHKKFLNRHSLKNSYMLTEFRVENSRADVVIINGTSNVYEIKTELDSFKRIDKQISSYLKVFDRINVISSKRQLKTIKEIVPEQVGLLELTPTSEIKTTRPAASQKHNVIQAVIFDSLRKNEYMNIIKKMFGFTPNVPNTKIFDECKNMFCTLSPETAHDEMVRVLGQRGNKKLLNDLLEELPRSLVAYVIDRKMDKYKVKQLENILKLTLGEVLESQ
ncbi:sce7726 family protein [candidate division KSB1 bacterium]|nr:sce7726 family protein [candidate division KSB1 bacterium]